MSSPLLAASDELDAALEVLTTKLGALNECDDAEEKKGKGGKREQGPVQSVRLHTILLLLLLL